MKIRYVFHASATYRPFEATTLAAEMNCAMTKSVGSPKHQKDLTYLQNILQLSPK